MVAFNFKPRFAPDVESGRKRRTMRVNLRAKDGDMLQLYTGMMQKGKCRKLRPDVMLLAVSRVIIHRTKLQIAPIRHGEVIEIEDYSHVAKVDRDFFARQDGFRDWTDMIAWFQETYKKKKKAVFPLTVYLYEW